MATQVGRDLLTEAMASAGMRQADLRRLIGLGTGHVSRLLSGKRSPSVDTALLLFALFGIPLESWATASARRKAAKLKRQFQGKIGGAASGAKTRTKPLKRAVVADLEAAT